MPGDAAMPAAAAKREEIVRTDSAPVGDHSGLSLRLDALVSQTQVADAPRAAAGLDLAATLTWLRSDISGMRADLDALRAEMAAAQAWVVARATEPEPQPQTSAIEDVVEDRLAALEDALDGLAERFEALARDSAADTGQRIAALGDQVQAVAAAIDAEHDEAALQRERDAQAVAAQNALVDGSSTAVRAGLDELAAAVATSLESFSAAMAQARQADRESERHYLETLLGSLTQTLAGGLEATRDEVSSRLAPVDERIDALTLLVRDGFGTMRAGLLAEVGGAITRLEHENGVVRATVEAGLSELRGDLADALDEVRDGVESSVGGAREAMTATLREHQTSSLDLRDSVVTSSAQLRDDVQVTTTQVRDDVLAGTRILHEEMTTVTAEVRESLAAAASHAQRADESAAGLTTAIDRVDATLAALAGDWQPQVDAVVAQGRAAAASVLEQVQVEVDEAISEMSVALKGQVAAIREVTSGLGSGTDRLVGAGEALLGYLAERDRELERERDRMLHDVLEEFAKGLSTKQRRAAAGRLGEALERRRDSRDADRFRRVDAERQTSVLAVPTEIAALSPSRADVPEPDSEPAAVVPADDAVPSGATTRLRTVSAPAAADPPAAGEGVAVKRATRRRAAPAATSVSARAAAVKPVVKKAASRQSTTAKKPVTTSPRATRSIPKRDGGTGQSR